MRERRVAGPYDPLYPEITRLLRDNVPSYAARWLYMVLVSLFYVEEDWEEDPVWITGTVQASKARIAQESGVNYKGFFKLWGQLEELGLVKEREDGSVAIPFYKKKGYDAISAREIRERFARLEGLHRPELEPDDSGPDPPQKTSKHPVKPDKHPVKPDILPVKPDISGVGHPFKGLKEENSLSGNKIISGFYRGIGQKRISKVKRERGLKVLRKLRKDKFDLGDIAFAVEWILENAKEELYDFSIIEHTIGQAIAARDKEKSERKEAEEREKAAQEERSKRDAEVQEREEIEAYKANLSEEKRAALRERAEAEISATGIYKRGFISEPLIAIKENELLRKERKK